MIVAIDPGIRGAAAALLGGTFTSVIDLPVVQVGKRTEIDIEALESWLVGIMPTRIVIENVHSMPREGAVGAFRFGVAVGIIRALATIIGDEVELVEPHVWKRYFDLLGTDKDHSLELARVLWPQHWHSLLTRVKDTHRAEAMLMAWWAVRPAVGKNWHRA
jgi:crossover junction endodeoxyribonuclease RuvC